MLFTGLKAPDAGYCWMMKPGNVWMLLLFLAGCPGLQAGLTFEKTQLELESGYLDEQLEVAFPFRNTGAEAVTISRMESSCGCTVPTLEKRTYQPGESGVIEAVFTFGPRTGPQTKTVTIHTDNRGQPLHQLSFKTDIPRWVTIQPHMLHWRKGESQTREIAVQLEDPEVIALAQVKGDLQHFAIEQTASGPGGYRYTVTPKPGVDRATERITFVFEARQGETRLEREITLFCLVR